MKHFEVFFARICFVRVITYFTLQCICTEVKCHTRRKMSLFTQNVENVRYNVTIKKLKVEKVDKKVNLSFKILSDSIELTKYRKKIVANENDFTQSAILSL